MLWFAPMPCICEAGHVTMLCVGLYKHNTMFVESNELIKFPTHYFFVTGKDTLDIFMESGVYQHHNS